MKTILIGGSGFIGHHLALLLKKQGQDVVVYDNFGINNIISVFTDHKRNNKIKKLHNQYLFDRMRLMNDMDIEVRQVDALFKNELLND